MAPKSGTAGTIVSSGIVKPSAPNALTNPLLQSVSEYKAINRLQTITVPPISMGSVATTASDGTPATFTMNGLDATIIRVYAAGSSLGTPTWVAGGGQTTVAHGLGRVPIGYITIRNSLGALISDGDSPWTNTDIYFHTTHSDSDCLMMIF